MFEVVPEDTPDPDRPGDEAGASEGMSRDDTDASVPAPAEDEPAIMQRVASLTGADVEELRRYFRSDPKRFVRRLLERYAPDAAAIYLDQIDELAEFARFRDVAHYTAQGVPVAQAARQSGIHNRQVVTAKKALFQLLDRVLTHVIGHPVQQHQVTASAELTETARQLTDFGAEFLRDMRLAMIQAQREDGPRRLPEAVDGEFEVVED